MDIEQQIEQAYQKLCKAQTKTAKTQAWNQMLNLTRQRSWRKIEEMEQRKMDRICAGW